MFNKIKKWGFTLVEVLIVIIIVGILIAALLPRLTGSQARARDTSRQAGINQVAQAAALYAADNPGVVLSGCANAANTDIDDYLVSVPTDPSGLDVTGATSCTDSFVIYGTTGGNSVVVGMVEDESNGNCTLSGSQASAVAAPTLTATGPTYCLIVGG